MESRPELIPFGGETPEERLKNWNEHLKALEDFAKETTAKFLRENRTAEGCTQWLDEIVNVEEESLANILKPIEQLPEEERQKLMPACHRGCSHCCYQAVAVDVPEAIAVFEFMRANCDEEEMERYRANARWYRKQYDALEPGTHANIACPALVQDACSVYAARPIICRAFASLSEEKCRAKRFDKYLKLGPIPVVVPLKTISHAMRHGVYLGEAEAGFSNQEVVLGLALQILLEDPKAVEKYLAGEDVFAPAAYARRD